MICQRLKNWGYRRSILSKFTTMGFHLKMFVQLNTKRDFKNDAGRARKGL
jgi:hypothetical protein